MSIIYEESIARLFANNVIYNSVQENSFNCKEAIYIDRIKYNRDFHFFLFRGYFYSYDIWSFMNITFQSIKCDFDVNKTFFFS